MTIKLLGFFLLLCSIIGQVCLIMARSQAEDVYLKTILVSFWVFFLMCTAVSVYLVFRKDKKEIGTGITIRKKVWPEYFRAVLDGKKNFEVRLADFDCQPGDILVLCEWDPETKQYSGREIRKLVKYVGMTKDFNFWKPKEIELFGYQIIGF